MEGPQEMEGGEGEEKRIPIFRDIRRYYCDYCGICRSKKALITSHILSCHKEEMEKGKERWDGDEEKEEFKSNTCPDCGVSFRKPAHLKQHMQSHSLEVFPKIKNLSREALDPKIKNSKMRRAVLIPLNGLVTGWGTACEAPSRALFTLRERPFTCPVHDCHSSYRRKDHLTRHLLLHGGKLFDCPVESCNRRFAYQANMKRHVVELHDEASCSDQEHKERVCGEPGCGIVFRYPSQLKKHGDSHVKLDSVEAICCEPGCMKSFSNAKCLKVHIQSCHQHITCEVCGTKQIKKNIKRHMLIHEAGVSSERFKCSFEGCLHSFANKSNLNQHVKAVHLVLQPFVCRFSGCGKKFSFKHVRDNHEKTGLHVYIQDDFEELDEQFQSRPRGGRKRRGPTIESLLRKRVTPPGQEKSVLNHASDYLHWLLSTSDDEHQ